MSGKCYGGLLQVFITFFEGLQRRAKKLDLALLPVKILYQSLGRETSHEATVVTHLVVSGKRG